jgi:hypothetical protein
MFMVALYVLCWAYASRSFRLRQQGTLLLLGISFFAPQDEK